MNMPRVRFGALVVSSVFVAAALVADSDATLKFDPARLGRLDGVVQHYVNEQQIAGAVLYVYRDGEIVRLKAFGMQDVEAKKPMPPDAIFRIASMSKAVTTVAALILYEEGKFMLHDPISKYIPAFQDSVVAVPPPEGSPTNVKFVTVKAKRPIQIRDLLTHTAGLTYANNPSDLAMDLYKRENVSGWYFANHDETIGEVVDRIAKLPLHAQPGEAFTYGFGTDVLGRLVEVVSGQPLDKFLEERVCRPLGMKDTCFYLPPEKADRLANVYGLENGKLVLEENAAKSDYVHGPRKCFSGGAGLLSTAADYGRFLQMLLNEGELDGARLLSPKTVRLMRTNLTGSKYDWDAAGFGLGLWVNTDLGVYAELGTEGAYGWASAYFPHFFVDPKEHLVGVFMTQLRPAGDVDLNRKFKVMIYQALVK